MFSSLRAAGETILPVARTSITDSWSSWVVDSTVAEILKSLFERTIKGTRTTGESPLDKLIRTVLPVCTTCNAVESGAIESATVLLTLPVNVTEPRFVCVSAVGGMRNTTPMSVRRQHFSPGHLAGIA